MKKTILISLALLVAVLLTAAVPAPTQKLSGTLHYSRANICMIPDYIALPVMDNIYLKGFVFPTHGQYQGCRIDAFGRYANSFGTSQCKVFEVSNAVISCPSTGTDPITR